MRVIKSKKATEGVLMPFSNIVGWIILFILLLFVFLWFSGLGKSIIEIFTDILK